eukprot:gene2411-3199_t
MAPPGGISSRGGWPGGTSRRPFAQRALPAPRFAAVPSRPDPLGEVPAPPRPSVLVNLPSSTPFPRPPDSQPAGQGMNSGPFGPLLSRNWQLPAANSVHQSTHGHIGLENMGQSLDLSARQLYTCLRLLSLFAPTDPQFDMRSADIAICGYKVSAGPQLAGVCPTCRCDLLVCGDEFWRFPGHLLPLQRLRQPSYSCLSRLPQACHQACPTCGDPVASVQRLSIDDDNVVFCNALQGGRDQHGFAKRCGRGYFTAKDLQEHQALRRHEVGDEEGDQAPPSINAPKRPITAEFARSVPARHNAGLPVSDKPASSVQTGAKAHQELRYHPYHRVGAALTGVTCCGVRDQVTCLPAAAGRILAATVPMSGTGRMQDGLAEPSERGPGSSGSGHAYPQQDE